MKVSDRPEKQHPLDELIDEAYGRKPPTIEQRAVRLAKVYQRAEAAAMTGLDGPRRWSVSHQIAMLLVKRELEAGDG